MHFIIITIKINFPCIKNLGICHLILLDETDITFLPFGLGRRFFILIILIKINQLIELDESDITILPLFCGALFVIEELIRHGFIIACQFHLRHSSIYHVVENLQQLRDHPLSCAVVILRNIYWLVDPSGW